MQTFLHRNYKISHSFKLAITLQKFHSCKHLLYNNFSFTLSSEEVLKQCLYFCCCWTVLGTLYSLCCSSVRYYIHRTKRYCHTDVANALRLLLPSWCGYIIVFIANTLLPVLAPVLLCYCCCISSIAVVGCYYCPRADLSYCQLIATYCPCTCHCCMSTVRCAMNANFTEK
jgi:hypothetical protein